MSKSNEGTIFSIFMLMGLERCTGGLRDEQHYNLVKCVKAGLHAAYIAGMKEGAEIATSVALKEISRISKNPAKVRGNHKHTTRKGNR